MPGSELACYELEQPKPGKLHHAKTKMSNPLCLFARFACDNCDNLHSQINLCLFSGGGRKTSGKEERAFIKVDECESEAFAGRSKRDNRPVDRHVCALSPSVLLKDYGNYRG